MFPQPFNLKLKARDDSSKIANVADNEKKRAETGRQVSLKVRRHGGQGQVLVMRLKPQCVPDSGAGRKTQQLLDSGAGGKKQRLLASGVGNKNRQLLASAADRKMQQLPASGVGNPRPPRTPRAAASAPREPSG